MKLNARFTFLPIILFIIVSFSGKHSDKIQKKVTKEITSYFDTEDFSTAVVKISDVDNALVKAEFGKENLLSISGSDGLLGYAYIGNAPSKTATFDYLVIFDKDFVIATSKVLIYREEYGGEIGSKRWLKQFIGKSKNDDVKFGENVDAISGATISVRSMTNAISNLLKSMKILHQKEVI
ncbi:hypothetical protein GCM10022393_02270 [Aquimarina addita]|uniref:FMN-binding domain-containing protein n=1 Tax=Aquimarina addita TaxID=870485 RepID=A0ABP7X907_9FLAO